MPPPRLLPRALFVLLAACGARGPGPRPGAAPTHASHGDDPAPPPPTSSNKAIKNADGSVTIVTTTTKWVTPPDPPDRAADPYPGDPLVKYNVEQLNAYRKRSGVAPLKYDSKVSQYAVDGSKQLAVDHTAHAHFVATAKGNPLLGTRSAENQGDWNGVPELDSSGALANGKKQLDVMLKLMFDEGPGGGHHDNMLDPRMKRVGIGLVYVGGKLYMTNDFTN